jgi:phosphate ABC transporter phosphate-binding protein
VGLEGDGRDEPSREAFEAQAAAAGLVLPRRTRPNPWIAAALVGMVVAASVGVGDLTGWAIGPRETESAPGLFGVQNCVGAPSYLSAYLSGAVSALADPALVGALGTWGGEFSNWSGGCVHVEARTSAGDGYVPELVTQEVDFVTTEAAPNASEAAELPTGVDLVPEAVAPVAVVYNLPGLSTPLRLSGSVLAGMYNGSITSWNDPEVAALNPGVDLAAAPTVAPAYRSDAADANLAFTTFLAESSRAWNASVGAGSQVAWPCGVGEDGAAGLATYLTSTAGAIGYLETGGPLPANASEAQVQNPSGAFVLPDPANATAAAAPWGNSSAAKSDDWSNVSLVNAPGAGSYPIATIVYFALYHDLGQAYAGALSAANGTWLLTFLWWLAADAQNDTSALGVGPLPASFVTLSEQTLESVDYDGSSVLEGGEGGGGGETGEF